MLGRFPAKAEDPLPAVHADRLFPPECGLSGVRLDGETGALGGGMNP